jgi:hypothetical protein
VRHALPAIGLCAAVLVWAHPALAQCALCKTVLTGSREGLAIARQFNQAILVLLFAPYMVFGSLAAFAFRSRIRARLARTFQRLVR